MRTIRTSAAAAIGALLITGLVACNPQEPPVDPQSADKPKATAPDTDTDAADSVSGLPPEPTGADRERLLRALAAANPDTVKYEDKAIGAARNQCSAVDSPKADWLASQRFTYKDVTTTEAQGKTINTALKDLGFCNA
ncbi:hypothetical protein [Streptomyces sp. NPDC102264]|uniref:hypothetical protein n=1 Tax=Streptomyces sp. NPDC102264 TaxID=3366149 RepID=UPI00380CF04E